jgi:hypothetical protein
VDVRKLTPGAKMRDIDDQRKVDVLHSILTNGFFPTSPLLCTRKTGVGRSQNVLEKEAAELKETYKPSSSHEILADNLEVIDGAHR